MKNKILAILLILIICVSMMPMQVSAYSSQELQIVKQEIKTDGYTIHYFAPEGYSDVFILKESETKYHIYFVESGGIFLLNTKGDAKIGGLTARIKNITSLEEVYDILFGGKYSNYTFQTYAAYEVVYSAKDFYIHDTNNKMYVSPSLDSLGTINSESHITKSIREDYMTFAEFYSEWYFTKNGTYPTPDLEDSEYMVGDFYVIMKQPIILTSSGGGVNLGTGQTYTESKGYVETCDNVELNSQDGAHIYVVISTKRATGDFMEAFNFNFFDNLVQGLKDFWATITGQGSSNAFVGKGYELMYADGELGEERNGYVFGQNYLSFFYSDEEYLNRYYFSNLTDASKFVLYGTAGATPEHTEEGKTHYGYGYSELVYSNYDIDGYDTIPIPDGKYPLKRTNIILRWHDENVTEREYLLINFNYFPWSSCLTEDMLLKVPAKLEAEYRVAYKTEDNESTFNYKDYSIYEKTDKYKTSVMQNFQIYTPTLEEHLLSNCWDLIYSEHDIYEMDKNGNSVSGGDILKEPTIEVYEDENKDKWTWNKDTNEMYKEGFEDVYTDPDGDGIYTDKNGNTVNRNDLTSSDDRWGDKLKTHLSALESATNLIGSFTDIINNSAGQMSELTALFNAFFKNIPSIFRTLIIFAILSIIIMRITRRK